MTDNNKEIYAWSTGESLMVQIPLELIGKKHKIKKSMSMARWLSNEILTKNQNKVLRLLDNVISNAKKENHYDWAE